MHRKALLLAVLGMFIVDAAAAADSVSTDTLTAQRVMALARTRAPQVRVAQSRLLEAQGRLAGARALGQENPTLEGVANTEDGFERRTQWELSVPIGIGLSWLSRTGVARAELERAQQLVANTRRGAVGVALAAYYQVLHASRRVELAKERRSLALDLQRTASERHAAGEVARLEVLLTETEEIRAASELLAKEEVLTRARLGLATTLGLPSGEQLAVMGDLADRALLVQALEGVGQPLRPDVLAAERELDAAHAAKNLARTDLLPGLAFRLNYGHEGGEALVQPGLAVTVPVFQYGQERRQRARARELRAVAELERIGNRAAAEVEAYERVYETAARSAEQLGGRALPLVAESESMVRQSYRAGKINLPELLIVRRDLLETRREYLDRLLDAALAAIDFAVAKGHFQ